MASQTRLANLALTLGLLLIVLETVAMETLARSATVRISISFGFLAVPRLVLDNTFAISNAENTFQHTLSPENGKSRLDSRGTKNLISCFREIVYWRAWILAAVGRRNWQMDRQSLIFTSAVTGEAGRAYDGPKHHRALVCDRKSASLWT